MYGQVFRINNYILWILLGRILIIKYMHDYLKIPRYTYIEVVKRENKITVNIRWDQS